MSRNCVADCNGIAASASRRWSRAGEWTSETGTAKTTRQGRPRSHRARRPGHATRRRPMTWSQASIAFNNGSRWASVHGSVAAVTSTKGSAAPARARSRTRPLPSYCAGSTTASAARPLRRISSRSPRATSSARADSPSASTTTRIPAPGSGSRRKCASYGSSLSIASAVATIIPRPGPARARSTRSPSYSESP
ncbi:MAG TPA: hypothetical protein VF590_15210, partial [Isosphaeraceae bacterium]